MLTLLLPGFLRSEKIASPVRVAQPCERSVVREPETLTLDLPPLDARGLVSIESRAERASPHQLHRWIEEIRQQQPLMQGSDKEHAHDLLLKLDRMLEDANVPF